MKNFKKNFILIFYFSCLLQTVLAQNNMQNIVIGTVLDSTTKKPVEYASISFSETSTGIIATGGITDPQGRFYIDQIPDGQYSVIIE